jgi:DNA-binding MarR family transcriptional regulator
MKNLVKLVLEFSQYEEKYPNSGIEDFSRYYLASKRRRPVASEKDSLPVHNRFAKLLGHIMRLNNYYANIALKEMEIGGLDEFTYLLTIERLEQPMKTEVINRNFHELSSGLLIIDRLIKKKLVEENVDLNDRRSKLIKLTAAGKLKLKQAQKKLVKVTDIFFDLISEDDIRLCSSILTPVDEKFSRLWLTHRGQSFDEVYGALTSRK